MASLLKDITGDKYALRIDIYKFSISNPLLWPRNLGISLEGAVYLPTPLLRAVSLTIVL